MDDKLTLLNKIRDALASGVLARDDLQQFVPERSPEQLDGTTATHERRKSRTSAVDVMFYIAGVILYAALLSVIAQTWEDNSPLLRIFLSVGLASILWGVAYYLAKSPYVSDIRTGLTNALLFTGSLSSITGAYILINELIGGYDELNFFAGAIAFFLTGLIHIGFDKLVRKDVILLVGTLLCVISVPATLFGVIQDSGAGSDIYLLIFVFAAGLLAYATRTVARVYMQQRFAGGSFDTLAAFVGLGAMYIGTYADYSIMWFIALIASILGIFYASVLAQDRHLLGSASFFLVISVITISFKYFIDFGVSISLLLATIGVLAAAAAASTIHKRYFIKEVQ